MAKVYLLAVSLALVLLTTGLYVLFQSSTTDPLAEFRTEDGKLTIPGGKFTPELQRLLFPPPSPRNYTTYAPDPLDTYPTLNIRGTVYDYPESVAAQGIDLVPFADLAGSIWAELRHAVSDVMDFFFGSAAAVDRFAVYGDAECAGTPNPTNLATDADCWSTTSGGNGDGLPVAGDNLVFDASSGAGTGTMDASLDITTGTINTTGFTGTFALATFILTNTGTIMHDGGTITSGTGGLDGGAMTMSSGVPTAVVTVTGAGTWRLNSLGIQAGGTFTADAATITMDGDFNANGGIFVEGISVLVIAATSTITMDIAGGRGTNNLYQLTINAGVIATIATRDLGIADLLTLNATITGAQNIFINDDDATLLSLGGTHSFGTIPAMVFASTVDFNVPSSVDYPVIYIENPTVATTRIATLQGNIISGVILVAKAQAGHATLDASTSNYNISPSGFDIGSGSLNGVVLLRGGTHAVGNGGIVVNASGDSYIDFGSSIVVIDNSGIQVNDASSYIIWGSSTVQITGPYSNSSTSATWNAGTATVTFWNDSDRTLTFGDATNYVGGVEFNNWVWRTSSGITNTFTISGNALRISGSMTWNHPGTGTTTVTDATNNLGITVGSITIATTGILIMGSATITVNGNWDSSAGTFTQGTSTVVFAADATITTVPSSGGATFYSLTINASTTGTLANTIGIGNVLTVNGTLTGAFTVFILSNVDTATPLVMGASGAWGASTVAYFATSISVTGGIIQIPASANYGYITLSTLVALAGDGLNHQLQGNITLSGDLVFAVRSGSPFFLDSQTFDVSLNDWFDSTIGAHTTKAGIKATSGTWTVSGGVFLVSPNADNYYIQWGSTAWTVSGNVSGFAWSMGQTTVSADWSVGTSSITFNGVAAGGFRFAAGTGNEFNDITFNSTSGTAQRFFAYTNDTTNSLDAAGTMTVSDTVSTTEFDVLNTGTPINVNVGVMTVGAGGILTAESSTITVSGNWNSSAGTFTFGTSTVVFAANATITTVPSSGASTFYNLTVNASTTGTLANSAGIERQLTVNGTLTGTFFVYLRDDADIINPLVVGGSGAFGSSTTLYWLISTTITGGIVQVPASLNYGIMRFSPATTAAGDGLEFQVQGNITMGNLMMSPRAGAPFFVNSQTFDVSLSLLNETVVGDANNGIKSTSGTWTLSDSVCMSSTNDNFYIQYGSTTWNVNGSCSGFSWNTVAVNTAASGLWGTDGGATVNINGTSAPVRFASGAGGTSATDEFPNLRFGLANGALPRTYNPLASSGSLKVFGSLTITDISSTTNFDTKGALVNGIAVLAGSVVIGAGGTLTANDSTITVSGNWDSSAGTFTFGTSTIVFAASGSIDVPTSSFTTSRFYNLTINIGVTATMLDSIGVANVTTVNGTLAGAFTIGVGNNTAVATPLVVGGSGSVASANTTVVYVTNGSMNVAGTTYTFLEVNNYVGAAVGTANGNIIATSDITVVTPLAMSTFNLTTVALSMLGPGSAIQWGFGSHVVSGLYINNATTALWDAGTGTVMFNSATGGTMRFAGTNLAEDEFNNVSFISSAGTAQTFTMATRGLRLGGTLTVSDTVSTTALDTSGSNLAITAGPVTVGAGGILTANGSTITLSGNFDFSTGTFTYGTSTVVFTASATIDGPAPAFLTGRVYNVTVNTGVTLTLSEQLWVAAAGTMTLNGTAVLTGSQALSIIVSTNATPFVVSGSETFTGLSVMQFWTSGANRALSLPGATYPALTVVNWNGTGTFTVTQTGNVMVSGTLSIGSGGADNPLTWTTSPTNYSLTVTTFDIDSISANLKLFNANASTVTVTGNVEIPANGAIDFATSSWTVGGTWTNASTNSNWDAGTGIVTFDSATGGTMTFAGTNLAEAEFDSVTFTSSAGTAQTFTMATRGLRWGGTLTITDGMGGTTLAKATLGLTGGALTISGAAASGLTSTSGDVTVTTVNISTATAFIDLGSEAWTVSGTWTNDSTDAAWDAGTGTVTFTSVIAVNMDWGALGEAEFNNVSFTGAATFTTSTADTLRALAAITIEGSAILAMGTVDMEFGSLDINGVLTMDGFSVVGMEMSAASGVIALTLWSKFDTGADVDVQWTFNPSIAGTTVTVILSGLLALSSYDLRRDGTVIDTVLSSNGGVATFSSGGGWSPHAMQIVQTPIGGGGGGGGGPGEGTFQYTQLTGNTFQFLIIAPDDETISRVTWTFGDGKTGSGNPIIHTYLTAGIYTVKASVFYASGTVESLTKTFTLATGPDIIQYLVAILSMVGFAGALFSRVERRKVYYATIGFVGAAWMLFFFTPGEFPFFSPRIFVQGKLIIATIASVIYGVFPTAKDRTRGGKARAFWLVFAGACLVLYYITRGFIG